MHLLVFFMCLSYLIEQSTLCYSCACNSYENENLKGQKVKFHIAKIYVGSIAICTNSKMFNIFKRSSLKQFLDYIILGYKGWPLARLFVVQEEIRNSLSTNWLWGMIAPLKSHQQIDWTSGHTCAWEHTNSHPMWHRLQGLPHPLLLACLGNDARLCYFTSCPLWCLAWVLLNKLPFIEGMAS